MVNIRLLDNLLVFKLVLCTIISSEKEHMVVNHAVMVYICSPFLRYNSKQV